MVWEVVEDFGGRLLSSREQHRIKSVVDFAAEYIKESVDSGASLRMDGFFTEQPTGRSVAKEAAEGVLLIAQREHEERKVRHLGRLLATLAVTPELDSNTVSWLVTTAEDLTWTHYVLLSMIPGEGDAETVPPLPSGLLLESAQSWSSWTVHKSLANLGPGERGLVKFGQTTTTGVGFRVPDMNMSTIKLSHGGILLRMALGLGDIADEDQVEMRRALVCDAPPRRAEE